MTTDLVPTVGKDYFITFYDPRLAKYPDVESLTKEFRHLRLMAFEFTKINPFLKTLVWGWPPREQFLPWKNAEASGDIYNALRYILGESGFAFRSIRHLKVVQHVANKPTVIKVNTIDRLYTLN